MAGRRYDESKNPFGTADDVDDDTFLKHSKSGSTGYMFGGDEHRDLEEKRLQILERKKQLEDRTLESSNRSLGLLRDSEQVGVATAEELLRQREQLERTEKRLDDINNTLRFSQKHINSIKSVFGSLKNYISGKNSTNPEAGSSSGNSRPSEISRETNKLAQKIDEMGPMSPGDHPAMRIRGLGENDYNPPPSSAVDDFNKRLDDNLDEMFTSLTRLKGLAGGLGDEIEGQNDLIERVHGKTDKADFSIGKQNKEINRLLRK